ncbi:hypothetical protein BD410DRAFT_698130, partial [Rickenella mellea]
KRLQRGGILYLTTSNNAARWLQQTEVRASFLRNYSSFASMRNRGHGVIVEYVPISYDPSSEQANQTVERVNGMKAGEILEARYLKDPKRRSAGQQMAFILMTIQAAEQANRIIREGIIVEGKKVYGRKNLQEPKRCLKCQTFRANHLAAHCKSLHDTCGQCGGMHRTLNCNAEPGYRYCSNCQIAGHSASDRLCPIFQKECEKLLRWHPENKYRYFPTSYDPSTW